MAEEDSFGRLCLLCHLCLLLAVEQPLSREDLLILMEILRCVKERERTVPEPEMKDGKFVFHLPVYPELGRE